MRFQLCNFVQTKLFYDITCCCYTQCSLSDEASYNNRVVEVYIFIAYDALIGGMGGAILNESILTGQNAIALLTNVSVAIPDHDAVLSVIKALNIIYNLGIKTTVLEESVKKIHEEISKVASEYKTATSDQDSLTGPDSIYR